MGKTPSPGKWIKSLLGKKSSRSSLDKGSEKLRCAKKEEIVIKVKDNTVVSNFPTDPPVIVSPQEKVAEAATQTISVPDAELSQNQPNEVDEPNGNLEEAATNGQAARQAREEYENVKGIVKVQAVIRGRLVRRQAVATYSCIWGIVKLQSLARGKKARSLQTGVKLQKTNTETENSEALQGSSWMENPKVSMIKKLVVSSPMTLPLKIQYGPEDPNSAKVWLHRWTQLQVWAPGPVAVLVAKSQSKKRSFREVETDKGKLKRGTINNKPSSSGSSSNEKPKRIVRKASPLGKELSRIENDNKSKQSSRKSTSAIKEVSSSLEVKDDKPRISLKKAPLSNGTRKSSEKKKKELKEPSVDKVSASEDDNDIKAILPETVFKDETSLEQDELKTAAEEEIQEPDVQVIIPENGYSVKPNDRRASLPAKIENHQLQEDGLTLTQSARKIPSYMAPTASAKARIRGGQGGSPRMIAQEKQPSEKNGTRRHSLPPAANGKLSAMSPRAHRLLIASAKGSINSDRSFSSSKDIGGSGDKSTKAEWKR